MESAKNAVNLHYDSRIVNNVVCISIHVPCVCRLMNYDDNDANNCVGKATRDKTLDRHGESSV